ncbi:hypothetical protein [Adhaeribacter aerolatus]|nr:hypothetical protein [Adhaeribacter aerolatus]
METQVADPATNFSFKQINKKAFVLNGISIFLGFIFFSSGLAKLYFEHKFPGIIGPVWLEARLEEYNLGLFARFVAYAQVIIGFLLLTLRYRTLGAIGLLPMLLNILVITISLHWQGTPYVIAVFLLLNLLLLVAEAPKLLHLIGFKTTHPIQASQNPGKMGILWLLGFALVLLSSNISYYNLQLAYIFNATGVFTALYSFYKGGRV